MNIKLVPATVILPLLCSPLLPAPAGAVGVQATITTGVVTDFGTNDGSFMLLLNDSPLPIVAEQTIALVPGDVLRAEVSTSAVSEPSPGSARRHDISIDIALDEDTGAVILRSLFNGTATANPESAQSTAETLVDCTSSTAGCEAPGLPASTFFISSAVSSTFELQENLIRINNAETPTGNVGGSESLLDFLTTLNLTRLPGEPSANVTVLATAQTLFDATASSNASIEVSIVPIPVPAAAWLLASALGLLAWRGATAAR